MTKLSTLCIPLVICLLCAQLPADDKPHDDATLDLLSTRDLTSFRDPIGKWTLCGDASLSPDDSPQAPTTKTPPAPSCPRATTPPSPSETSASNPSRSSPRPRP